MRLRLSPRDVGVLVRATSRRGPTLAALAEAAAARFRDRTALVVGDRSWSFAELWRRAERLAGVWHRESLDGPRTVVVACEGAGLVVSLLAGSRLGLDVWLAHPGRVAALEHVIPDDALLVHEEDAPAWHRGPTMPAEQALARSDEEGGPLADTSRRGRLVLMTAGTTGTPVPHVARQFSVWGLRQLRSLHERIGIASTDTVLACWPLHQGNGVQLVAASLLTGATLVAAPRSRPHTRVRLLLERGATMLSGTPTQLGRLLDHLAETGETPPPVRRIVSGSEPLDARLVARLHDAWGPIVCNAYGTTETGTVTVASPDEVVAHPGTVGRAIPGTQAGIVGHPTGEQAEGRVWVRGAGRTIITDDRGRMDDGRLTILGRMPAGPDGD
ncbi:class I adenylate-forming enzyme family protein [Agrococcus versicolor]